MPAFGLQVSHAGHSGIMRHALGMHNACISHAGLRPTTHRHCFSSKKIPPMGSFWQQGFAPQEKNTPYGPEKIPPMGVLSMKKYPLWAHLGHSFLIKSHINHTYLCFLCDIAVNRSIHWQSVFQLNGCILLLSCTKQHPFIVRGVILIAI